MPVAHPATRVSTQQGRTGTSPLAVLNVARAGARPQASLAAPCARRARMRMQSTRSVQTATMARSRPNLAPRAHAKNVKRAGTRTRSTRRVMSAPLEGLRLQAQVPAIRVAQVSTQMRRTRTVRAVRAVSTLPVAQARVLGVPWGDSPRSRDRANARVASLASIAATLAPLCATTVLLTHSRHWEAAQSLLATAILATPG